MNLFITRVSLLLLFNWLLKAEGYTQQLELASKEVDNCRTRDDLSGGTRNSFIYKNSSVASKPFDVTWLVFDVTWLAFLTQFDVIWLAIIPIPDIHDYSEKKRNESTYIHPFISLHPIIIVTVGHHKRSRAAAQEQTEEESPPLPPIVENPIKEAPVAMTISSSSSTTSAAKPPKKKVKMKKR